jgi:hypothetical protein
VTQADPTKPVEAQIGEHMVMIITTEPLVNEVRYIAEANTQTLADTGATAVRTYLPEYAMEDSEWPRVSVIPVGQTSLLLTRSMFAEQYEIDVIVHRRIIDPYFEQETLTEASRLESKRWQDMVTQYADHTMRMAEQIRHRFESLVPSAACLQIAGTLTTEATTAWWMGCRRDTLYQQGEVSGKHVIFSMLRHQWGVWRQRVD